MLRLVFLSARRNNLHGVVSQWSLQAFASSHGARIQTSAPRPSSDHRHRLRVDWLDDRVGCGRQEPVNEVRAGDRFDCATVATEFSPDAGEGEKADDRSLSANTPRPFSLVSGFGSGAYSEKLCWLGRAAVLRFSCRDLVLMAGIKGTWATPGNATTFEAWTDC